MDDDLNKVLWSFDRARQTVVAVKRDWKADPMPRKREEFTLERAFTDSELANLRRGNVPKAMENKWFFYMCHNKLFAHRSWTGYLIFVIEIDMDTNIHKVIVNRDSNQVGIRTIEEDIESINELLNWWVNPQYDYYNEWISETYNGLKKAGMIEDDE